MKPRHSVLLLAASLAASTLNAATFNWTNTAGGSWATPGNWNAAPTFTADDVLDFSTLNITTNAVTTIDAAVTAGTLKFGDATSVSHNWTVNPGTGGTLNLSTTTGNPTITTVAAADAVTISAPISGTQTIFKTGPGTLNLTGSNTFTGIFQAEAAAGSIVTVSGDQSSATGGWRIRGNVSGSNTTVNFQSGSTIVTASGKEIALANESGGDHTLNVAGTVTNSGGLVVQARGILNINNGATWTQNGSINAASQNSAYNVQISVNTGGAFTYAGTNPISLSSSSGTGTGSSTLTLNGGTFTTSKALNNSSTGTATTGASNLVFSNGGTLKLSANIASLVTITTAERTFNVTLGTGGGKIDTNGFSTGIARDLTGTGSLTKLGAGTLTLTGTNTYTGATSVNAGTLSVSTTDQFSDSAALSLTTGAVLELNHTNIDTVGSFRIDGVTQPVGKWGRIGSVSSLGANFETALITGDGLINNTNSSAEFYWDGTGASWSSAAAWSYEPTNAANNPAAPPDSTSIANFGGDGLTTDQTISLNGSRALSKMTFTSPVIFNFTGGGTDSDLAVGTGGITLNSTSAGIIVGSGTAGQKVNLGITGAQTWTNLSTAGTLTTSNDLALDTYSLTLAGAGGFIFNGPVTGTGTLRKMGLGSLELNGTDTFTGDKTIDRGTILIGGNQSSATGGWLLRGYGDSGTAFNTVSTTTTFKSGSTVSVASGKTVQIGNNGASGGFQFQTLNANGTTTNAGSLFVGRAGVLNVGGTWTQSGIATVFTQGGGLAAMNVTAGGSFNYTSATQFLLTSSGSLNTLNNLTIDGGVFTTGVKVHNNAATVTTGSSSGIILANGGTLKLSADVADLFTTAGATNRFVVNAGGGIVDTNGFFTTLNVAVTGVGGLIKSGAGTLTTTGTNAYTGDTTVNGGTLSLAGANLDDASSVTIASGGTLNLNFSGADQVAALTINGTALAAGTYNNITHPTYITGSGQITVVPLSVTFASWASDLGLSGNPEADFDHDGISDAVEFVLGTDPKAANASTVQMQKSGSDLVVTFNRDDESEASDLTLIVEAGGDLQSWPQQFQISDTTANSSAGVSITENADSPDTVVVTIPTSGAGSLFARIKVVISGS